VAIPKVLLEQIINHHVSQQQKASCIRSGQKMNCPRKKFDLHSEYNLWMSKQKSDCNNERENEEHRTEHSRLASSVPGITFDLEVRKD